MKTTISILFWCALSTSGQENRQISFTVDEYPKESIIFSRQIRQDTLSYDQQVESAFTDGVTRLTINLNNHIPNVNPELANSDLAFGPLTIAGALTLVLLASVGDTANEIATAMGLAQLQNYFNSPLSVHKPLSNLLNRINTNEITSSDGEVVSYATGIFIQYGYPIRQEFLKAIDATYKSDIVTLNYIKSSGEAQEAINSWVSKHTNAKIPKLLNDAPSPDTTAILASVLYFKAAWEFPFSEELFTQPRPFFVNGRHQPSDRNISMMINEGEFPYFKDNNLNAEIMGFPYKGRKITMYVLLPNDSNQVNLRNLEQSLTPDYIRHLVNSTRTTKADILFPKLKIVSSVDLKSVLETVGIRSLFNQQQSNLALMSPGESDVAPISYPEPPGARSIQDGPDGCGEDQYNITKCNVSQTEHMVTNQFLNPLDELDNVRQTPNLSNPRIYVDQIIHKVYIEITESGTEAASVAGIISDRSATEKFLFRLDVPFLFFIYHEESKAVLFWGSVKNPHP